MRSKCSLLFPGFEFSVLPLQTAYKNLKVYTWGILVITINVIYDKNVCCCHLCMQRWCWNFMSGNIIFTETILFAFLRWVAADWLSFHTDWSMPLAWSEKYLFLNSPLPSCSVSRLAQRASQQRGEDILVTFLLKWQAPRTVILAQSFRDLTPWLMTLLSLTCIEAKPLGS